MTDNHEYHLPERGAGDWHVPINENFEALDVDVEVRDEEAALEEYEPKDGAKFFATDTGAVYVGDGDAWTARDPSSSGGAGRGNRAVGDDATIPGGRNNLASGDGSLAAGSSAMAVHRGAMVLGDGTSTRIRSESAHEVRSQMPIHAPSFNTTSARAAKTDVEPVEPDAVLEDVTSLDVCTWTLDDTEADAGRHVGPMAGEFAATFDLGSDEESIASVDADGVALAAIQGLAARVERERERRSEENEQLRDEQAALHEADERLHEENERLRGENEALRETNETLREANEELHERVAAVEERLDELDDAAVGTARADD